MRTMQAKITEAVRAAVEDDGAGLELVERAEYANTGWWFVMSGLKTWLEIRYSFQGCYVSFDLTGADDPRVVAYPMLRYADSDRLTAFLALLGDLLAPQRTGGAS